MENASAESPSRIFRLDAVVHGILKLMKDAHIPGIGLGVICNGETVVSRGFGLADVEEEIQATDETVFAIGSLSKAFTAAACGLLVADQSLNWGKPTHLIVPISL
jgi:CubicO group peptidase (beta-lactamase class C family)